MFLRRKNKEVNSPERGRFFLPPLARILEKCFHCVAPKEKSRPCNEVNGFRVDDGVTVERFCDGEVVRAGDEVKLAISRISRVIRHNLTSFRRKRKRQHQN